MKYLEKVNSPIDLKKLSRSELVQYAAEVREYIVDVVSKNGGHLASNLGVVELTIALHYVFDTPYDKILFDVGHQSYTHKIITGRRDQFVNLRKNNGISGFLKTSESEYDAFTMGHSSTSLSIGLGMVRAKQLNNEKYRVVSIIGDGALTGGMAYEALNDIGANQEKMIIILNDNTMSISKNVGAMSDYLSKLRMSRRYNEFKRDLKKSVYGLPFLGNSIVKVLDKTKEVLKASSLANIIFENMGIKYYGPFDGHDISNMINIFNHIKNEDRPVLIHLITQKGHGNIAAESNPSLYHGVSSKEKSIYKHSFSSILGSTMCDIVKNNNNVACVTAAMEGGTGLQKFATLYKEHFFDVGIAEEHAVSMCAGLASQDIKPYFCVYSSFLQRAFDQILHDVCIDKLNVTFVLEHAGFVSGDGITHQGVFDISYLNIIPNMTIFTPKDGEELRNVLLWSVNYNGPLAIRYPKGFINDYDNHTPISLGKWEYIRKSDSNIYLLCAGNRMLDLANEIDNVNIINCRFIKPLDSEMLDDLLSSNGLIITLEDNMIKGGFGEAVLKYSSDHNGKKIIRHIGYTDFVDNLDEKELLYLGGGSKENLLKIINQFKGGNI